MLRRCLFPIICATALLAQKYSGPQPEKPDLPYLVHADNLVATEASEAKEESHKDESARPMAFAAAAPLPKD